MNAVFHVCKDQRQHTGSREKCHVCTPNPRATAENQLYVRQVMRNAEQANQINELKARNAELESFVREALMNCSIDNHGGGEDLDCEFCVKGGALLAALSKQKAEQA